MPPLPKKKHSKKRKAGRSAHHFLKRMAISTCPQCRSVRLPHRVCPNCGYYNGREVVPTDSVV
ncbi:MAG TPA: 50S ribosomal protein L32 [Dehalococcoidia bacterium]|nr:50S ribosomal protein L32 [Dehalococcoidia bacterium]MBE12167.1 50S ribosomal protein L32 [Chloroflexota bacterium]MCH2316260.1 50S ribosomal protein L32 [SAR202 cluster bacterium]MCD5400879.1 50S ribosomal protein L32 [Dehalococcoidia bacterium]MQG82217.1 50S ribosomal protein L32 [SAR202 cluster bacterium]